ncbi:hypothetical protein KAU55_02620 [Candidatus Bathyarchaeota archaeon]|nr:hypothetical protein [Candidatus Bathyarchaeota archaeon]
MRLSKFKIAVLLLLTITVIYAVFLTWSFIEYNAYVSTSIATVETQGIFPPGQAGDWVDPHSYSHFWYGKAAGWIGIGLTVSWVFIPSSKKKENKNG